MSDLMAVALRSKNAQRMLRALRDGDLSSIEPVIEFGGGVDYPALHGFFDSMEEAVGVLSLLSEIGLLRSEIVDNVVVCPLCQSYRLMVRMHCPSCGSSRLVRGAMIEHLACGHIDFEDRFRGEEGLICPHCKRGLGPIKLDYRLFSFLYRCLSCKGVFSSPRVEYLCSNGHSFGEGEIAVKTVRAFRLNPDKMALLERLTLDLEAIFKPLRDRSLVVESPAEIYGGTGVKHDFSFAIWGGAESKSSGEAPIAVGSMHISDQVITATDVLAFWAKAVDVGAKHKFMVTLGSVDKGGRELADVYGVNIIEGRSSAEVVAKAKAIIDESIGAAMGDQQRSGAVQDCRKTIEGFMLSSP